MRAVYFTGGLPAPSGPAKPVHSPPRAPHRAASRSAHYAAMLIATTLAACANDPLYLQAPMTIEAGVVDMTTGMLSQGKASLQLPIKTEAASDAMKRAALAGKLGVMVPYVKVGDIELDVEWTIKNPGTQPGHAKLELHGANEFFSYD